MTTRKEQLDNGVVLVDSMGEWWMAMHDDDTWWLIAVNDSCEYWLVAKDSDLVGFRIVFRPSASV